MNVLIYMPIPARDWPAFSSLSPGRGRASPSASLTQRKSLENFDFLVAIP